MTFPTIRKFAVLLLVPGVLAVGGGQAVAQTPSITISTPVTLSAPSCKDGFALSGAFPNQTLTCAGTPTPTGPPSGCQVTANPASLSGTGSVQLTMFCGGGAPTNYSWSASPAVTFTGGASTAGNANGALITQTTAFTVVATNASPGSSTATTSVQVGGGGGGGAGAVSCSSKGFAATQYYEWDWGKGGLTIYTDLNASNVQQSVGADWHERHRRHRIYSDGHGVRRHGQCFGCAVPRRPRVGDAHDFDLDGGMRFLAPFPWTRTGDDAGVQFTVGDFIPRVFPPLVAGTRYYINVATRDAAGTSTCANAGRACDMVIQASRP